MEQRFVREMMSLGIVSIKEQESLWNIATRCAKTTGVPMAGVGGLALAGAGSVTVPLVGAIPGYLAGALAGLISGTVSCTMLNVAVRRELQALAKSLVETSSSGPAVAEADNRGYTAVSNIMKTKHDTVKNSISNIR